MNFLKKLFGGGGGNNTQDAHSMYFYVRPKRCNEVVQVRVNLYNDLSHADEGGYFVRKVVRATRCPFAAELHVNFDDKRRVTKVGVEDGETVDENVYREWLASQETATEK